MAPYEYRQRTARFTVEVSGSERGDDRSKQGASRRKDFWNRLRDVTSPIASVEGSSRTESDKGTESDNGEDAYADREKKLEEKVLASLKSGVAGMKLDARIDAVKIVGYGSVTVEIQWLGPDIAVVLANFLIECLDVAYGQSFQLIRTEDVQQASVVGGALHVALAALPRSPATLFFVLLFFGGLALLYGASNAFESLAQKRMALVEKLSAGRSDTGQAWRATFEALSSSCSAIACEERTSPPMPRERCPPPKPPGPSCCDRLVEAVKTNSTKAADGKSGAGTSSESENP